MLFPCIRLILTRTLCAQLAPSDNINLVVFVMSSGVRDCKVKAESRHLAANETSA